MIERLTDRWRKETAQQEAAIAAGTLSPDEAYALTAFPPDSVAAVDAALQAYEQEIASLNPPADEAVWVAVERAVLALNRVDEEVLAEAGIDVKALLQRRGVDEAAGRWRDW